ncbi:hypothetical protein KUTeg_001685 [Tegillarca granosa]|uniref:Major facilitator superfamily (MFS) profile domain-containing protein n=1 Tax=Tegillarca granosa TaxID=220873 RepID=A0ABQ9FWK7_TEGGR|nr:hypothetical protein KUTeg_001685 [Tegillarca granosa]
MNNRENEESEDAKISLVSDLYTQKRKDSGISIDYGLRSSIAPLTNNKKETLYEKYTSCRWIVTYLLFILLTLSVTLRQSMSMALVCMTQNTTSSYWNNQSNASTGMIDTTKYFVDWTYEQQGIVLSAYFYGFPITPVLGGYLSGKFGGKRLVLISMTIICAASVATPIAVQTNIYLVVAIRIIIGLTSGGLQPGVAQINSRWAPIKERAVMVAFVSSGMNVGNIVTYSLSGLICNIPLLGGWPFIFYIFGAANFLCLIPWIFCIYDNPIQHPRINRAEFAFITKNRRDSVVIKMPDPPWVKIICSKAFWGLLIAHVSHAFLFTTIGTYLPIYMNAVLQYDIFEIKPQCRIS